MDEIDLADYIQAMLIALGMESRAVTQIEPETKLTPTMQTPGAP